MARTVTITGSRSTDRRSPEHFQKLFGLYLAPFAHRDSQFYVGGAVGIDTLTLSWLAAYTRSSIAVVVPCTVDAQPQEASHAIKFWDTQRRLTEVVELNAPQLGTDAYHARNRWMVDRSEFIVGFPRDNDQCSGTWYTLNYAAGQGKPRMIVPI
ncbi:hypothetical protein [Pseudonocardia acaciae]|uniref:hypothetical protein n=1 Tax=Pseudonocardia acaciae TaxID=551276 RepID=UPI00048D0EB1|nr:hypothetical protein [Pseudonocardia acaciae]